MLLAQDGHQTLWRPTSWHPWKRQLWMTVSSLNNALHNVLKSPKEASKRLFTKNWTWGRFAVGGCLASWLLKCVVLAWTVQLKRWWSLIKTLIDSLLAWWPATKVGFTSKTHFLQERLEFGSTMVALLPNGQRLQSLLGRWWCPFLGTKMVFCCLTFSHGATPWPVSTTRPLYCDCVKPSSPN